MTSQEFDYPTMTNSRGKMMEQDKALACADIVLQAALGAQKDNRSPRYEELSRMNKEFKELNPDYTVQKEDRKPVDVDFDVHDIAPKKTMSRRIVRGHLVRGHRKVPKPPKAPGRL